MKRFLKILSKILGSIIAIALIVTLVVMFAPNPNDYKPQIAKLVENATGRNLIIEGDINLTFYPWLGLDLGKVSFGNAPNFAKSEFAKVNQTQVRVRLIPLFRRHVELDTVLLDNAQINLTRKPDGSTNWDDLVALVEKDEPSEESKVIKEFKIKGLNLRHAKITFDDQQAGSHYVFSDVNLNTSALVLNEPVVVKLNTALDISGATTLSGQVDCKSKITLNQESQKYRLEPLQLFATIQGNKIPGGKQELAINTKVIDVDLKQQTITLDGVIAKVMEAILSGKIQAYNFQTNPTLLGKIKLADLDVPKVMKKLGLQALPNEKLLKIVELETRFKASLAEISLKNLNLLIDDNKLTAPQLNVDINKQTLTSNALSLQAFGMQLNSKLKIKQIFSQPTMSGKLALAPFNLRTVLQRLEQAQLVSSLPLPDKKLLPLKTVALQTQFKIHKAVNLKNFSLRVDDNQLKMPQLDIDLKRATLKSGKFSLQVLGMNLQGNLNVNQLFSQPQAHAEVTLAPFNPQKILKRLGQSQLQLPKPFPLTRAALQTSLNITPENLTLKGLQVTVDKHQLDSKHVNFNFAQDTLTLDKFTLKGLGVALNGNLAIQGVSTQPTLQGSLKLPTFNPRNLLRRLGQTIPKTTDPTVLKTVTIETKLQGSLSQLNFENFKIRLDNSKLEGKLSIQNFQQPATTFHLDVDNIDIDRYLPPPSTKANQFDSSPVPNGKDRLLPLEILRALNLNGALKIAQLKVANLKINDIHLGVSAQQGKIKLTPKAALYDGTYQGNLILDAKNQPPIIYIEQKLTDVQANPLFTNLLGYDQIIGTTNFETWLTTEATTSKHLLQKLNGNIRFEFLNGAIKGFNIEHTLRQARALLKAEPLPHNKSVQTNFTSLRGTFIAKNGILYNNNLTMKSPLLRVNGGGQMKLDSKEIFFNLNAAVQSNAGLEEFAGINIPIKITGNWNAPTVQPNLVALEAALLRNLFNNLIKR